MFKVAQIRNHFKVYNWCP